MKNIFPNILKMLFLLLLVNGCTEPYEMETNTFEEAIVIEATITDEFKVQTIKLSKTYRLEEDGPTAISDANVTVSEDAGTTYSFTYNSGVYTSDQPFQAVPGQLYHLNVITADGKHYSSNSATLSQVTPIESITATKRIVDGVNGVQISANSFDPTGNSKYYRYEYEETYKVIAERWASVNATIVEDGVPGYSADDEIVLVPRVGETRTCYSTAKSDRIILTSTNGLSEDRVEDFSVRFIEATDHIIRDRYSIKVIQYVQSLASYTFYKTLQQISGSGGSILSQNQPGFFYGNVRSVSDANEKVIGFFEVSSVSSARLFFDFEDIFPGEPLPDYFQECEIFLYNSQAFTPENNEGQILRIGIADGSLYYYQNEGATFHMVRPFCSDCTLFSSNIIPEFWED